MPEPVAPTGAPPKKDPGSFGKTDTDLGKFSHGNFDVRYDPSLAELRTTFRAKYEFENGIPFIQQGQFRAGMLRGMEVWDNSGVFLKTDSNVALNKVIQLRFELVENNNCHKVVDVYKDHMRPYVFDDLNISIDFRNNVKILAHELGHILGNYDEYHGTGFWGWFERRMWWHDNDHLDDETAIMNGGMQFRKRYFDHFQEYVNENFEDLGIHYKLEQGPAPLNQGMDLPIKQWIKSGVNFGYRPFKAGPCEFPGPIRSRRREFVHFYTRE